MTEKVRLKVPGYNEFITVVRTPGMSDSAWESLLSSAEPGSLSWEGSGVRSHPKEITSMSRVSADTEEALQDRMADEVARLPPPTIDFKNWGPSGSMPISAGATPMPSAAEQANVDSKARVASALQGFQKGADDYNARLSGGFTGNMSSLLGNAAPKLPVDKAAGADPLPPRDLQASAPPPPSPDGSGSLSIRTAGGAGGGVGDVRLPGTRQGEMNAAMNSFKSAAEGQASTEAASYKAEAANATAQAGQYADQASKILKIQQETAAQVTKAQKDYEAITNEFKTVAKVDPDRYWNQRNAMAKVLAVFGASMSGATGNQNGWLMMQKLVDNDIDAQKTDISNQMAGINARARAKEGAVKLFMDLGHDQLTASNLAAAAMYEKIAADGKAIVAQRKGDVAMNGAKALVAQAEMAKIEKLRAAEQNVAQLALAKRAQDISRENNMMDAQARTFAAKGEVDKKRADLISEVEERTSNVVNAIGLLQQQIEDYGTYEMTGPQNENMVALLNEIGVDMAKLRDPKSAAREGEVRNELRAIGLSGGEKFLPTNKTAKETLEHLKSRVLERKQEFLKARGIIDTPAGPVIPQTPIGKR